MPAIKKIEADWSRKIAFAAPDQIHGAVKQIVGWAEMSGIHYNGKPLTERDFLNGLVADFYMANQDDWWNRIESNMTSFEKMQNTRQTSRKKS